jgi:hypothetical protein
MLKIKQTDRMMIDEVFQKVKEERLHWRQSWIGHIIKHKEQYPEKKALGIPQLQYLKQQKHRSWWLYANEMNGLQQFQMESCQPIKRLKQKKKKHLIFRRHPIQIEQHLLQATMNIEAARYSITLVYTHTMSQPKYTVIFTFTTTGISDFL